jgi:hypothetical protein
LHGTLSGIAPNLTYTPSPGFDLEDSFSFVVNDGELDSAPAVVDLLIHRVVYAFYIPLISR